MAIDYKKIVLKNSPVSGAIPIPDFLDNGELALNYADNKIYYKTLDGSIVVHETPDIAVDPNPNSIVRRNLDGSGTFNGVISESTESDIYSIYATHNTAATAKIINTGVCAGAEISSDYGPGAEISSIINTGATISSQQGTGARIYSSTAGIGAEISSNENSGAKIYSTSGIGAEISSISGIGAVINSGSELALLVSSTTGRGAEITSSDVGLSIITTGNGIGLEIQSVDKEAANIHSINDNGAIIYTQDGNYHATFGDTTRPNQLGISNNVDDSIDIDWLSLPDGITSVTGKLKSGATSDQTWTLPDETGILATTTYAAPILTTATSPLVASANGNIYHLSGTPTLTLPSTTATGVGTGWTIGIVNVGGGIITVNVAGSDTINGSATSITNSVQYSALYIYKSADGAWIAIGVLY